MTGTVLRIDASPRSDQSVTRALVDRAVARLAPERTIRRDLAAEPLPQIDAAWIDASFTPADRRSPEQAERLALSDTLVAEIEAADTLVIGVPIYNFGVPAALKAWIDLIARAGRTFRFGATGSEGLLRGKRAILVVASGGTPVGAEADFATGYLRHVLGFVGIDAVEIVAADRTVLDPAGTVARAEAAVDALAA